MPILIGSKSSGSMARSPRNLDLGRMPPPDLVESRLQTGIVMVKNNSGSDVARFGVLGIDGALVDPATNADEFAARVVLKGITPTDADHTGKFVVLLESVKSGDVARAYISGVCPAKVDVIDADDTHADVKNSDRASLESRAGGSARVLWKESGTGVKWAIVLLGDTPSGTIFPVTVSQTGGSNGNSTTAATYTYTVTSLAGVQLGTAMSPEVPRFMIGTMTAATKGTGYYTSAGVFTLHQVFEVKTASPC
jgi:hypothetical protein